MYVRIIARDGESSELSCIPRWSAITPSVVDFYRFNFCFVELICARGEPRIELDQIPLSSLARSIARSPLSTALPLTSRRRSPTAQSCPEALAVRRTRANSTFRVIGEVHDCTEAVQRRRSPLGFPSFSLLVILSFSFFSRSLPPLGTVFVRLLLMKVGARGRDPRS